SGDGWLPAPAGDSDARQRFALDVAAVPSGQSGGRMNFWTVDPDGRPRLANSFDTTDVTMVAFLDDPAFRPGNGRTPTVDTVAFAGSGRWNNVDGYTSEARATDQGEPGAGKDTFTLTVRDAGQQVVFSIAGTLTRGNIQSSRLPGRTSPPMFLDAPSD